MNTFTDRQLTRTLMTGIGAFVAGLTMFLLAQIPHDPEGFWNPYITAMGGSGLMALLFGVIWVALALAHRYSNFFDLDRKLDADKFMLTIVIITVAVLLLLFIIMPRLPSTPLSQLPTNPQSRTMAITVRRNFKLLVAAAIVLAGIAVASVPTRRFLRG